MHLSLPLSIDMGGSFRPNIRGEWNEIVINPEPEQIVEHKVTFYCSSKHFFVDSKHWSYFCICIFPRPHILFLSFYFFLSWNWRSLHLQSFLSRFPCFKHKTQMTAEELAESHKLGQWRATAIAGTLPYPNRLCICVVWWLRDASFLLLLRQTIRYNITQWNLCNGSLQEMILLPRACMLLAFLPLQLAKWLLSLCSSLPLSFTSSEVRANHEYSLRRCCSTRYGLPWLLLYPYVTYWF